MYCIRQFLNSYTWGIYWLYKGLKGESSVPTDDLIPKTRRCRNRHSMAFQTPIASTDVYKGSFFLQTIRIAMPSPILWSHPLKMQRIVLLSSLLWWELGTNSLITGPGEWLSFRRFISKLSWSWSWYLIFMIVSIRYILLAWKFCIINSWNKIFNSFQKSKLYYNLIRVSDNK